MRIAITTTLLLIFPTLARAAGPVYFDLEGLIATVAAYLAGLVILFFWLAKAKTSASWKWIVAIFYLVGLPGCPVVQMANLRAKDARFLADKAQEEREESNKQAESFAAYVKFCQENLKGDSPLADCKRFRSLEPYEEQQSIK